MAEAAPQAVEAAWGARGCAAKHWEAWRGDGHNALEDGRNGAHRHGIKMQILRGMGACR